MAMRRAVFALLVLPWLCAGPATAASPTTQTIVFLRHGEKPAMGLGQLTCQGLNRALALPAVIARDFGRPDAIFAPDPAKEKSDGGRMYDYIRPLATVEPSAIYFGLPVEASIGFLDTPALVRLLNIQGYQGALVLVGWEHHKIVDAVQQIMTENGGNPALIPDWKDDDFDSLYVVKVAHADGPATATFELRHEGLDGQSTECPGQPPK
jgi:hypothetical protein